MASWHWSNLDLDYLPPLSYQIIQMSTDTIGSIREVEEASNSPTFALDNWSTTHSLQYRIQNRPIRPSTILRESEGGRLDARVPWNLGRMPSDWRGPRSGHPLSTTNMPVSIHLAWVSAVALLTAPIMSSSPRALRIFTRDKYSRVL